MHFGHSEQKKMPPVIRRLWARYVCLPLRCGSWGFGFEIAVRFIVVFIVLIVVFIVIEIVELVVVEVVEILFVIEVFVVEVVVIVEVFVVELVVIVVVIIGVVFLVAVPDFFLAFLSAGSQPIEPFVMRAGVAERFEFEIGQNPGCS